MEKRSNVQAIIIIILVVILIGATVYLGITHFTKQNNQLKPNQQLTDNKQQENEKTFEKQFVNYLAEVVIQGAKNESLLKDTEGNATADKLTEREAINNKGQYIKILEKNMNNREIFSAQFIKDEKQCIVFNMEKMLNLLGVGTHMGTGMGVSDDNGMQLYMVGDKATVNSNNVFEEFGVNVNDFAESVFLKMRNYAKEGVILKDTEGNVTADKVRVEEIDNKKHTILETIKTFVAGRDSSKVWKEDALEITYPMESILNELGWGSHMGAGLGVDREGNITETI